jgi:Flp pilus assembly protein TadG
MLTSKPHKRFFVFRKNFSSNQNGATAVEFALISVPFFMFLFAILENAMSFWSQQVLETAVSDAARQVYTGEFQKAITAEQASSGSTLSPAQVTEKFQKLVCDRVTAVFSCSRVKFDVRNINNFSSSSLALPVDASRVFDTSSWQVVQPSQNSIVLVRAAMEYPSLIPMLKLSNGALASGNKLIIASAAFMTEPY